MATQSNSTNKNNTNNTNNTNNNNIRKFIKDNKHNIENDIHNFGLSLPIKQLIDVLQFAADNYYNTDELILSDYQYDTLLEILTERDPKNPFLAKVGAPIEGSGAVKLPYWLGSMDKIKPTDKKLDRWLTKFNGPYVISDKLDGISGLLVVKFDSGSCTGYHLYTRGDGITGQNITKLIQYQYINMGSASSASSAGSFSDFITKCIKLHKKYGYAEISLRGELIMKQSVFNSKYAREYPKARSLVAGCVNAASFAESKSFNPNIAKDIDFLAYEVVSPALGNIREQFEFIDSVLGIGYSPYQNYEAGGLNSDTLTEVFIKRRTDNKYDIDGIIVADSSRKWLRNVDGNPEYAVAFKMPLVEQTAETRVVNIEWNVSKNGMMKPTVVFEPVIIGGDKIQRATGFNAAFIRDNKLGVGAIIQVIKSGDVIPYIKRVVKASISGVADLPSDAGIKYYWNKTNIDIVVNIDDLDGSDGKSNGSGSGISNSSISNDIKIKRLANFFKELGIKGLGEGIIAKLVGFGYDDLNKLYAIRPDMLATRKGFGVDSATKICDAIKLAFGGEIDVHTLAAASIVFEGIGAKKFQAITDIYPNVIDLFKAGKLTRDMIMGIAGYSSISTDNIMTNMPAFISWLDTYPMIKPNFGGKVKPAGAGSSGGRLTGMIAVMTGFRDDNIKQFIINNGGDVKDNVSGNTTLVVVKDSSSTSSKVETARQKGIKILTKDEFIKEFNLV